MSMVPNFDLQSLCSVYDRGWLVPFIGSGMSRPACSDWPTLVARLQGQHESDRLITKPSNLIEKALFALQALRHDGRDIPAALADAIYSGDSGIPEQAIALASIVWPLICTTNYDDLYFRAKYDLLHKKCVGTLKLPRLLGRSEADCREVLRHVEFPAGEAIWALQGFLKPRSDEIMRALRGQCDFVQLERELVVGHAEYRTVAHRALHFRRCFAELFRTRSFLFLGSGLAEPYFTSLFDEIIELMGPPVRPHFAVIQESEVNPEFMRQRYHIICRTYPKGEHRAVTELLRDLRQHLLGERARPASWGYTVPTVVRPSASRPRIISDLFAASCRNQQFFRKTKP